MPIRSRVVLAAAAVCFSAALVFASTAKVPRGSQIQVVIEHDTSMKVGKTVHAKTVYPVYEKNQLIVPAGSELTGVVTHLSPVPKAKRRNAKLGGDFTPLHNATIRFDELVLPNGNELKLKSQTVGQGAQVVRFIAAGTGEHQSLVKKLWSQAIGREKEAVRTFTAPGKKERARRMLYSELPYHPELLVAGTQYSVELDKPLTVKTDEINDPAPQTAKGVDGNVKLAAALTHEISSRTAVPGTKVEAVVTEPLYDEQHELKVPQGSVLEGEITQAQSAGKFGKDGTLRFSFRELKYPAGYTQRVHGAPTSVDTDQSANLQLDEEGGVKPGPKGIAAPLVMGLLATSAVHEDEASVLHTGGASNGFALIGRVAALASKSSYVGAAFGFYGTGRAVYSRYIAHGKDVDFPKNTRIEVVLGPEKVNALKPVE